MPNGSGSSHLSGQQRWFLTGYRVTLPLVVLAVIEQLSRYGSSAIAAAMGSALVILSVFWLATLARPVQAMAAGIWIISAVAWLSMLEGIYLVIVDPPVGVALMRETTYWIPIICAYWAMMFYARPWLAIAMVVTFNILVLTTDLYARVEAGNAILHGTPIQGVLQIVILVAMVWVFGGVHSKIINQRNVARTTAIRDPLTGLHNRLSFEHELRRVAQEADRYGYNFGLIILDIDRFKRFNDKYGHLAGDSALQTVAQVCRRTVRRTDLISRWGGEEFAVIIHDAIADQAFRTAEKLRQAVAGCQTDAGEPITISCGVALYRPSEELRTLFERADAALLLAKEHGRNRVMCCPMNDDQTISGPPP
jgi:diguanylate cyclase (GGDEF)-like protein